MSNYLELPKLFLIFAASLVSPYGQAGGLSGKKNVFEQKTDTSRLFCIIKLNLKLLTIII